MKTYRASHSLVDFRAGIVSCLGNTLDDVADSLYHARSGIKHMPKYAEIGMKSQVAGRPELDLNDKETIGKIIDRKSARFMGDNAKYVYGVRGVVFW